MDERRQSRGEVVDGGPGYAYMMFILMESLLDKLKLLNYDTEFTQELKMKYINRYVRYKLRLLFDILFQYIGKQLDER